MDDAELVGGVLFGSDDPRSAAGDLAELLTTAVSEDRTRALGFDPELVRVLRRRFSGEEERIKAACSEGAAWVLGRRSAAIDEPWELVASLPSRTILPAGLRRTTGETLVGLIAGATTTIRITAPFVDEAALRFLSDALIAATRRAVVVEMFYPPRSNRASGAMSELQRRVGAESHTDQLKVTSFRDDAPWAHLKVLTVDSSAAYIGSANVTGPALAGPNLELGVVVRGPRVRVIEDILDMFRQT